MSASSFTKAVSRYRRPWLPPDDERSHSLGLHPTGPAVSPGLSMTMLAPDTELLEEPEADERLSFPCSSSQMRCWFVNAVSPGNPALNVALRWELKGPLSSTTIERAFQVIVDRHEMLRTRFVEREGIPRQEVMPKLDFTLSECRLTLSSADERMAEAIRLGRLEARKPFDLAEGPLIRAVLVRLADDHALLFVTIHQIAFDGWSIRLISSEFATAAAAIEAGKEPNLPELPLQYGDYSEWQAAYLASGTFEQERTYWRRRLSGAPYFEIPGDRERPPQPTSNCEIIAAIVPQHLSDGMAQRIKDQQVTQFSFGCAVIAAVLHRYTGVEDICIGTQVAGREDPDLDHLIGVFINNLVLRFDVAGDPTFLQCLERANQTVQDALVHQRMPFHTLVELLKPPRNPRRMPLISVNFTVLQDVMDNARHPTFELLGHPSLSAGSLYDLNFFMVHWPETGWRMALEYNTDLFDQSTGRQILDLWSTVFKLAVEQPDFKPSEVPLADRDPTSSQTPDTAGLIEAALLRHEAVAQAAVIAREEADGSETFHAFVTPSRDYVGTLEGVGGLLEDHVGDSVHGSQALTGVSLLMGLPTTPAGSPDRTALAALLTRKPPSSSRPPSSWVRNADTTASAADMQAVLTRIWTEVLGVSRVAPDADFFDLGGHSLLALRMLARVEAECGLKMQVSDLFLAPTLAKFAACLFERDAGRNPARSAGSRTKEVMSREAQTPAQAPEAGDWRLMQVRPDGKDTAIFGINTAKELHDFWEEIGGDRGLYSVQLFEPGRQHLFGDLTFEGIAAAYLELIRRVQPRGPYMLFGLCVHGVLAYEIAQQMKAAGDEVELLAFKSAWHPTYFQRLPRVNRWTIRLGHVRDNFRLVIAGRKSFAEFLAHYSIARKSGILSLAVWAGLLPAIPPRTGSRLNDEALLALMAARDAYAPKPYDGRVIQFLGADAPRGPGFDPTLGWSGVITGPLALREDRGRPESGPEINRQASDTVSLGAYAAPIPTRATKS